MGRGRGTEKGRGDGEWGVGGGGGGGREEDRMDLGVTSRLTESKTIKLERSRAARYIASTLGVAIATFRHP